MPRNVYSEINLHLTWHTKDNAPVLVEPVESRCHKFLTHQCLQIAGVSRPRHRRHGRITSIWRPASRRR